MTKAQKIMHQQMIQRIRETTNSHATTQMKSEATTSSPNLNTAPASEGNASLQSKYNQSVA